MINIYNWSYEIEKNLVRIEFGCTIKTKIQNIIQQFNGQQLEKMVKFEYDSKYFFNAFDKWRR